MTDDRPTCLVFPHEEANGPVNMARDECLLEIVSRDETVAAAFRTYGWTQPTLSLGYFQGVAEAECDPRWQGAALVRRSTGGGAILHHHEITYALAVARGHPLARQGSALYEAVHDVLAALLKDYGVDARRRGVDEARETRARPFLCFADRAPEDVVVGGVKVIGSAQRRRAGAVLQHGSILLARAPLAPELPGVTDLSPIDPNEAEFRARIGCNILNSLGFTRIDTSWTEETSARVERIAREVYAHRSWTARR